MATLQVCDLCGNARWVIAHNGLPWHGQLPGGRPCPSCNEYGGDGVGYNLLCVSDMCPDHVDVATFIRECPEDQAVIAYQLDEMAEQLGELEEPGDEAVDCTKLSRFELFSRNQQVHRDLVRRDEMPFPRTEKGREMHSLLAALHAEMHRRTL